MKNKPKQSAAKKKSNTGDRMWDAIMNGKNEKLKARLLENYKHLKQVYDKSYSETLKALSDD